MDKKTILVVEDNWQDRALMTFMLESAGYSVLNVLNGAEAIRAYVLHQPAIVLVVLGTPGCTTDLWSFADCILEINPRMPILFKSGEPLTCPSSPCRSSNRLKPLSLMVRILRAIEGQADWSEQARHGSLPQHSFFTETTAL